MSWGWWVVVLGFGLWWLQHRDDQKSEQRQRDREQAIEQERRRREGE